MDRNSQSNDFISLTPVAFSEVILVMGVPGL